MKLKEIVPNFDMCKKMDDAGIDFGKTVFVYARSIAPKSKAIVHLADNLPYSIIKICNAPTTDEMLRWLPSKVTLSSYYITGEETIEMLRDKQEFSFHYGGIICSQRTNKYPAKALAELCLWVKVRGHK